MLAPCSSSKPSEVRVGKVAPRYILSRSSVGFRFYLPGDLLVLFVCAFVRFGRDRHTTTQLHTSQSTDVRYLRFEVYDA